MKYLKVLLIIILQTIFVQSLYAASAPYKIIENKKHAEHVGMLGFGFQYLGVSLKYYTGKLAYEAKCVKDGDVYGYGPRLYFNFNPYSDYVFYVGGEYCSINGKTEYQKLSGNSIGAFLGMELFFDYNASAFIDFGPYSTALRSEVEGISVSASDIVCNLGFNIYF